MKPSKKSINAALPSLRYFQKYYVCRGFAGILPSGAQTLRAVIFRIESDGGVSEKDYAFGEAFERDDYYGVNCIDAEEVVAEWMKGNLRREEVVDRIQELFKSE